MSWQLTVTVLGVLCAVLWALRLAQQAHFGELRERYRQAHLELEKGVVLAFDERMAALEGLTASTKARVDNIAANQKR